MNWTCPYCNQPTTVTSLNKDDGWSIIGIAATHLTYPHQLGLRYDAISCPNPKCKKIYLVAKLTKVDVDRFSNRNEGKTLQHWQLLPESSAMPQPDYIPEQIVQDYTEACRIKDLSPKASATLARRCLQGMIRNFWNIKKDTLKLEIDELESHVSTVVWDAIDAVRSVGNIGAHMEKDVNTIVEIEPEEADLLIGLIEDLLEDWFVVRHDREQRQLKIKELALQKQKDRKKKDETAGK